MSNNPSRRIIAALVLAAAAWIAGAVMVSGQEPPNSRIARAEDVFTNVQLLKGLTVSEFMGTMGVFSASLGLNCTECHVPESGGDWRRYADDIPLKQVARRMIVMVDAINRTHFGGRQVMTCNTCHRGSNRPNPIPSLAALYGEPPPAEPGAPFGQASGQPSADAILDRYLQALGGAHVLGSIKSFSARGTYVGFDDPEKVPLEVVGAGRHQRAIVVKARAGDIVTTISGDSAWVVAPSSERPVPLLDLAGDELEGAKLETEVFFPAQIRQALTNWRVGFPVMAEGRRVHPVQGNMSGGGTATLCFDAETFLLTRVVRLVPTPVGPLVTQVDYSDYRDVAGIKLPFRWTVTWLNGRSHYELAEIRPNVPIDPARFLRPAR